MFIWRWLKKFGHDVLQWHDGKRFLVSDRFCSTCGKRVLQDSTGSWFVASRQ